MLVCRVYQFYVYFHVRIRLNCLVVPLLGEDGFSKVKNYFGIYAAADGNYAVGGKATQTSSRQPYEEIQGKLLES